MKEENVINLCDTFLLLIYYSISLTYFNYLSPSNGSGSRQGSDEGRMSEEWVVRDSELEGELISN